MTLSLTLPFTLAYRYRELIIELVRRSMPALRTHTASTMTRVPSRRRRTAEQGSVLDDAYVASLPIAPDCQVDD